MLAVGSAARRRSPAIVSPLDVDVAGVGGGLVEPGSAGGPFLAVKRVDLITGAGNLLAGGRRIGKVEHQASTMARDCAAATPLNGPVGGVNAPPYIAWPLTIRTSSIQPLVHSSVVRMLLPMFACCAAA